jgi:hypothetical protein
MLHFIHQEILMNGGGVQMLNHYAIEKLMKFQQADLEQRARHAWKWEKLNTKKQVVRRKPVFKQPEMACCPGCC